MLRKLALSSVCCLFTLALVGCPQGAQSNVEEAVEEVEDETQEAVEEVEDETQDAIEEVSDEIDDATGG